MKQTTLFTLPFTLLLSDAWVPPQTFTQQMRVLSRGAPVTSTTTTAMASPSSSSALDTRRATSLSQLFDELQNDFFFSPPLSLSSPASSLWKKLDMSVPAAASITVDVKETDKDYQVDAELPGMKKEDIKLSFTENGNMVISAERNEEKEEKREGEGAPEGNENKPVYYFKERSYGKVYRSFKLPPNADTSNVEAKLQDGVLKVTLPKRMAPTERMIEIK